MPVIETATAAPDIALTDLGPLAWVLDETRKAVGSATRALRRFVDDAGGLAADQRSTADASQLRVARQQLHQAAGAMDMVGQVPPARILRAMEDAVQYCVQHPERCTDEAVMVLESASFGLLQYLEAVLQGKPVSPLSLFPQYQEVQVLGRQERVHPADLWPVEWRWLDTGLPPAKPLSYDAGVRPRFEQAVLKVIKTRDSGAARLLRDIGLGFASAQTGHQARAFWAVAAGFFDALSLGLCPNDVHVKRATSRILQQYNALVRGDPNVSERLAHDLLFFCAQALAPATTLAPALNAVRRGFGLESWQPVDYDSSPFGRFDPAVLVQARKRIGAAKEAWSSVAGGDLVRLRSLADHFGQVADSLVRLHPPSTALARGLTQAAEATVQSGTMPTTALAMEVATAVMYLEAAFEDLDPTDARLALRTARLAERLQRVQDGEAPEPLEAWIEELYRSVSDRQTMGSVVGELRTALADLERSLDQFFRNPKDASLLTAVPGQLAQMRGVLSVLGLDQAVPAVLRMRDTVEQLIDTDVDADQARATGTFDKLGNNLGALGLLFDMLNYQPLLAKKLFVYDESEGELRPIMGRVAAVHPHDRPARNPASVVEPGRAELQALQQAADFVRRPDAPAPLPDMDDERRAYQATAFAAPEFQPTQIGLPGASGFGGVEQAGFLLPPITPSASWPRDLLDLAVSPLNPLPSEPEPKLPLPLAQADEPLLEESDLLDIFLEEVREVVQGGNAAIDVLAHSPQETEQQTVLRRAFHTLKGSSRMVGLSEFGNAAWSLEQLLNSWLADRRAATEDLCVLTRDALQAFARWAQDIADGDAERWSARDFQLAADALRLEDRFVLLQVPGMPSQQPAAVLDFAAALRELPSLDLPAVPSDSALSEPATADFTAPDFTPPDTDLALQPAPTPLLSAAPEATEAVDPFDGLVVAEVGDAMGVAEVVESAVVLDAAELVQTVAVAEAADVAEMVEAVDVGEVVEAADVAETADAPDELSTAWIDPAFPEPVADVVAAIPVSVEQASLPDLADFSDIDLDSLALAAGPAPGPVAEPDTLRQPTVADLDAMIAAEFEAEVEAFDKVVATDDRSAAPDEPGFELDRDDEQYKRIGDLRIGIPLYNVYLNEADEWSRRLMMALTEWAMELPPQPLDEGTVSLAHSLAGSSATVGFTALSALARELEHAMGWTRLQNAGTAEEGRVFTAAAEEIRRLLHQFAAGFLKEPDPEILAELRELHADKPLPLPRSGISDSESPDSLTDMPLDARSMPVELLDAASLQAEPELALARPTLALPESQSSTLADEDLDSVDALDADLFQIFQEEAGDLFPMLGGALRQWSVRPDNRSARAEVLRVLHTLKGSARLAGAMRLGERAHRMETVIEQLDMNGAVNEAVRIEPLLAQFDALQTDFDNLALADSNAVTGLDALSDGGFGPGARGAQAQRDGDLPEPLSEAEAASRVDDESEGRAAGNQTPEAGMARAVRLTAGGGFAPARTAAGQAVRIRSQLLDQLVNQTGEVMMSRSRLEAGVGQLRASLGDLTGNLDRLRQQLRDVELQAELQMQSRLTQSKDGDPGFDPLELDRFTRVQELTRMMAESVNDVGTVQRNLLRTLDGAEADLLTQARQARELQRDLLRTRMVEFETIAERLYRVVRQAAKDSAKQVKLDITGGSIEMDRGVLDRMTPAFEHLLRNAVAHGVESPEARHAAGKPAVGALSIHLSQEGNDVSIAFSDDGGGLDPARIAEKAKAMGLLPANKSLQPEELLGLIFTPGFSTAAQVTELSGRGIGMDVVRSEVLALGGRIESSSEPGQGARFNLILPLTTAVTQVVMVRAGRLSFGVPANLVEQVRRTPVDELGRAYADGVLPLGGEALPFFWSGALLQSSGQSDMPPGKTASVVVFRSAQQRVALHVDEVLGNQEVVVKNLGPQLSRLPGLSGMTVLASGAVVLIYNPVALASVYGNQVHAAQAAARLQPQPAELAVDALRLERRKSPRNPSQVPLVLVVDDSITVRRVTQRLLQREGYRVALAVDGVQALERLRDETPALMLSDIEMPRMDGFELARSLRASAQWKHIPIITISSRMAERYRQMATEIGVNHYLGKPYGEEELLSLIRRYAKPTVPA